MKTFDQSEHNTRIWYHGTAESKACLQAPLPFPPPQNTARLASLADIFPYWPRFLPFFPHCGAWPQARMMKINPMKTKIMVFKKYERKKCWFLLYHKKWSYSCCSRVQLLRNSNVFVGKFFSVPWTSQGESSSYSLQLETTHESQQAKNSSGL